MKNLLVAKFLLEKLLITKTQKWSAFKTSTNNLIEKFLWRKLWTAAHCIHQNRVPRTILQSAVKIIPNLLVELLCRGSYETP